jgi:Mn2+/Fe2+ NRAMP family transporter
MLLTAFLVPPNWPEVAHATFVPTLPEGPKMWQTVVASTTISPYLFFWLSWSSACWMSGPALSNLIMFFIILTAALTLYAQGKTEITTSREAAEALRSLAGDFAVWLYALAIVAVGLLSIPTLAGSAGYARSVALAKGARPETS